MALNQYVRGALALIGTLLASSNGSANDNVYDLDGTGPRPTWELGLFGGALQVPNYPGAESDQQRALFFPYLVYRGKRIQVGEGGLVNAKALENPRFQVDLSLSAALNVNTEDEAAREGMPELDYMLGIGPRLSYQWVSPKLDKSRHSLATNLNTRLIFSSDFKSFDDRGVIVEPTVVYRYKLREKDNLVLLANWSSSFASRDYLSYLYDVAPQYETPERAAYQADAGYFRSTFFLGLAMRPQRSFSFIGGVRVSSLAGSTIRDSSLVKQNENLTVFLGFRWLLWTVE